MQLTLHLTTRPSAEETSQVIARIDVKDDRGGVHNKWLNDIQEMHRRWAWKGCTIVRVEVSVDSEWPS